MAVRIQARAIKRCGELLKTFSKGDGRPPKNGAATGPVSTQRSAARDAGLSKRQEKQAVNVADVPKDTFEELVESDKPRTVT
jgi:hypothetical protein